MLGHAARLAGQLRLVLARLIEQRNGLVDFVTTDRRRAGLEPVSGGEAGAGGLLGLDELSLEDVPVREGLFGDKGGGGMVLEWVEESRGFGGALANVRVADGL